MEEQRASGFKCVLSLSPSPPSSSSFFPFLSLPTLSFLPNASHCARHPQFPTRHLVVDLLNGETSEVTAFCNLPLAPMNLPLWQLKMFTFPHPNSLNALTNPCPLQNLLVMFNDLPFTLLCDCQSSSEELWEWFFFFGFLILTFTIHICTHRVRTYHPQHAHICIHLTYIHKSNLKDSTVLSAWHLENSYRIHPL